MCLCQFRPKEQQQQINAFVAAGFRYHYIAFYTKCIKDRYGQLPSLTICRFLKKNMIFLSLNIIQPRLGDSFTACATVNRYERLTFPPQYVSCKLWPFHIDLSLCLHRFITQATFCCSGATVQHLGGERLRALKMDFGTVNTQLKFHTS